MKQTQKAKTVFGIWEGDYTTTDGDFWNQYDSLEDAVADKGDGCEVYALEPRYLGKFKRKVEMVKIKRRKKARKHK